MKRPPFSKLVMLLLLTPLLLVAQVTIDLQIFNVNADVFYLGDLDFLNTGNVPDFFQFTMQNNGPDPERIFLRLEVRLDNSIIASAETDAFELPVGPVFVITQTQINTGTVIIPDAEGNPQNPEFRNYQVDLDVANIRDQIIATNKLPAGQYIFEIIAFEVDENNQPTGQQFQDQDPNNNILLISNPTTLELLFPGRPVSETDIQVINSVFPYLQWESDAKLFNVFVYKKESGDNTVQDVFSHPPILELRNFPEKRLQYPSDTAPLFPPGVQVIGPVRLLEFGGIYYWYVQAVIHRSSGVTDYLNSDVFRFQIADFQQNNLTSEQVLRYLEQILGPEYQGLLKSLLDQGYTPNGNVFYQGTPVDMSELTRLLLEIAEGKADIKDIQIY